MTKGISKTRRREVAERSGGICEVADCERTTESIHHIVWRSDGGTNALDNLLDVCQPHHDEFHHVPKKSKAERRSDRSKNRKRRRADKGLTQRISLDSMVVAGARDSREDDEYRRKIWLRSIDREIAALRGLGIPVVRDRSIVDPPYEWKVRYPWLVYDAQWKVVAVAADETAAREIARGRPGAKISWVGPAARTAPPQSDSEAITSTA